MNMQKINLKWHSYGHDSDCEKKMHGPVHKLWTIFLRFSSVKNFHSTTNHQWESFTTSLPLILHLSCMTVQISGKAQIIWTGNGVYQMKSRDIYVAVKWFLLDISSISIHSRYILQS